MYAVLLTKYGRKNQADTVRQIGPFVGPRTSVDPSSRLASPPQCPCINQSPSTGNRIDVDGTPTSPPYCSTMFGSNQNSCPGTRFANGSCPFWRMPRKKSSWRQHASPGYIRAVSHQPERLDSAARPPLLTLRLTKSNAVPFTGFSGGIGSACWCGLCSSGCSDERSTCCSRCMNRPTKPMTVSPSPSVAESQHLDSRLT